MNGRMKVLTAVRATIAIILAAFAVMHYSNGFPTYPFILLTIAAVAVSHVAHRSDDEDSTRNDRLMNYSSDLLMAIIPTAVMIIYGTMWAPYLVLTLIPFAEYLYTIRNEFKKDYVGNLAGVLFVCLPAVALFLEGPIWDSFGVIFQIVVCIFALLSMFLRMHAEKGRIRDFDYGF